MRRVEGSLKVWLGTGSLARNTVLGSDSQIYAVWPKVKPDLEIPAPETVFDPVPADPLLKQTSQVEKKCGRFYLASGCEYVGKLHFRFFLCSRVEKNIIFFAPTRIPVEIVLQKRRP